MKVLSLFLIFLFWGSVVFAQSVRVNEKIRITSLEEGKFFFPQIIPPGDKIAFTGPNFKGLYIQNLVTNERTVLSEDPGAGYDPVFSPDGKGVFYRSYSYKGPRRYASMISVDMVSNEKQYLEQDQRDLSTPRLVGNTVVYVKYNQMHRVRTGSVNTISSQSKEKPLAVIENRSIALYQNAERQLLKPLGDGIYIWPSVSPDGTRLLFTFAGDGTYIADLEGKILVELGMANAPQWSPNGDWIAFMDDKDDGHVYTASEIYIIKSDGTDRTALTSTNDDIEMYPSWGSDNQTLVYATNSGEIFLLKLALE